MEKKVIQYASRDAVQYAQRWALSRNRDYNDFTKGGGDCMNSFRNACMQEGCLSKTMGLSGMDCAAEAVLAGEEWIAS